MFLWRDVVYVLNRSATHSSSKHLHHGELFFSEKVTEGDEESPPECFFIDADKPVIDGVGHLT